MSFVELQKEGSKQPLHYSCQFGHSAGSDGLDLLANDISDTSRTVRNVSYNIYAYDLKITRTQITTTTEFCYR